ncbi:MAG: alginate lyase family protein [Kiritimatiellaeota bacterium]|nr:alginate lyase family protein [Kiritimatiellota bacterium]
MPDDLKLIVDERFSGGPRPYQLPLPHDLLMHNNFFDLYPLDGGGGLASHSMIATINDADYACQIITKQALRDFGTLPHLDHQRFEQWRSIEKSCWLNRFYFIVPLAKQYAQTKNETLARLIIDTLLHFIATCPPPVGKDNVLKHQRYVYHIRDDNYNRQTFEQNLADKTDVQYIWFDFQPASRVLHWMHVFHFLKDSPSISKDEWNIICQCLYQHGEAIYYGEHFGLDLIPGDNHQSLRGLALLLAGTFFKGFGLWQEFISEGVKIINFHSRASFAPDGSEIENSPSYHIFTTWHIRDAYLLSQIHGFSLEAEIKDRLIRQADVVRWLTDPQGMTVVLNDGYTVNGAAFLKSMSFLPVPREKETAHYFPDAGIAILRRTPFYLCLDASPYTGQNSHYHGGKNALSLWAGKLPFLIDSGCPPYDEEKFSQWYKLSQAHSSLLINGAGDSTLTGTYDWQHHASVVCAGWQTTADSLRIAANLQSSVPAWQGVRWERTVAILPDASLRIDDTVKAPANISATFILNLHPAIQVQPKNSTDFLLAHPDGCVLEMGFTSSMLNNIEVAEGLCYLDFKHRQTIRILIKMQDGKNVFLTTLIARKSLARN